jgi:hypothetical protein
MLAAMPARAQTTAIGAAARAMCVPTVMTSSERPSLETISGDLT